MNTAAFKAVSEFFCFPCLLRFESKLVLVTGFKIILLIVIRPTTMEMMDASEKPSWESLLQR